jgi:hypothetical protein
MAGDWIKMRVDLGDDPAVVQMAACLDTTEDEVVGKLHRLWSWADRHTTDGTAPAITPKWVDRYVGCTGFAGAMEQAGWISFSDAGVVFPSFERHNGESAKRRGEAALRQRLSRKNRDEGVTGVERTTIPRPFVRHVMTRDGFTCVYCGEESTAEIEASRKARLSVDHIKPITRGGSAAVENLACCCRKCNSEKSDRTPEEWGMEPTFLQPGVVYSDGQLVTDMSHKNRDKDVTREEKRREERNTEDNGLTPGFERFWSAWPKSERKAARGKCFTVWKKAKADALADAIVAHVESLKRSSGWQKNGGAFIPAPLVYLNERRWEGADDASNDDPYGLRKAINYGG